MSIENEKLTNEKFKLLIKAADKQLLIFWLTNVFIYRKPT